LVFLSNVAVLDAGVNGWKKTGAETTAIDTLAGSVN
jgi:3-mercaptopyruvate sulfurtransferase SseA